MTCFRLVWACSPQKIHPHAKPLVGNRYWTTPLSAATIAGDETLRFRDEIDSRVRTRVGDIRRSRELEWTGRWYSRGYAGDQQLGVGTIYSDLQSWPIIAGILMPEQAGTLFGNIQRSSPASVHRTAQARVGALQAAKWVIGGPSSAAAKLGIKRTTLQSNMQKLGIPRPSQRRHFSTLTKYRQRLSGLSSLSRVGYQQTR